MESRASTTISTSLYSQSSVPTSNVDPISSRPGRFRRQSITRSKDGCKTCRRRRVKCDELRPKCGPCTRLGKQCSWRKCWRFYDSTARTQKTNQIVSTKGSPSWDKKASKLALVRQPDLVPCARDIHFNEIDNEDEREQRALTQAPGTFYVVLTPRSFTQPLDLDKVTIKRHECVKSSPRNIPHHDLPADPNALFVTEFKEPGTCSTNSEQGQLLKNSTERYPDTALTSVDARSARGTNDQACLLHFKNHIHRKIVPLGSTFAVDEGDGAETIIRESQTFRALHHAIRAIVLLDLALSGHRYLLVEALQHYRQAIISCITGRVMSPRSLLHFHCVLLIFDISYPTQSTSFDRDLWSQHFRCLEFLTRSYAGTQFEELPHHLISSILFLDAQASFAGNSMAGSFVQAYQAHILLLPTWRRPYNQCECVTQHSKNLGVNTWLSMYAELSQLALQMRKEVEHGHGAITERQHRMDRFRDELRGMWSLEYPADSARCLSGTVVSLAADNAADKFASMQCSTMWVYLNTSMYSGQRMHTSEHQREETSVHCRHILCKAASLAATRDTGNQHIVFSVFLAGVNSLMKRDRNRALSIIRVIEGRGVGCNVTESRKLLEAMYHEQEVRARCGQSTDDLDWVSFGQEQDIKIVSFGV